MGDFIGAENVAMGDVVLYGNLSHEDSSAEPEEREEAMERRLSCFNIVAIESCKLAGEDDLFELLLSTFCAKVLLL